MWHIVLCAMFPYVPFCIIYHITQCRMTTFFAAQYYLKYISLAKNMEPMFHTTWCPTLLCVPNYPMKDNYLCSILPQMYYLNQKPTSYVPHHLMCHITLCDMLYCVILPHVPYFFIYVTSCHITAFLVAPYYPKCTSLTKNMDLMFHIT